MFVPYGGDMNMTMNMNSISQYVKKFHRINFTLCPIIEIICVRDFIKYLTLANCTCILHEIYAHNELYSSLILQAKIFRKFKTLLDKLQAVFRYPHISN